MKGQKQEVKNSFCQDLFRGVVLNVDSIFITYNVLHKIYSEAIGSIEDDAIELTQNFANQVSKMKMMIDNCKRTVENQQLKVNSQLHEQGLVLLVGSSESILRETFRNLLRKNLEKVRIKDTVSFSFKDVKAAYTNDETLPDLVLARLENEKNPAEKFNFQNVKQMQGTFENYFGFEFSKEIDFGELHKYWQIRHLIIHNRSIPDQKFIHNLEVAKIDVSGYALGKRIQIHKSDYDECKSILEKLFEDIDNQINRHGFAL